ncbi:hypothetical protein SAMN06269173_101672 [Hymenobacter mucosus]|uniref:Uncharacterized protein n=1 Tax=Hymenobacter mucosus TaxID=1411120 RepID=A0A238VH59_9BACT|nr:hypothetical protein SAMN06269173_101672 [Hymenobacter mucosus]
MNFTTILHLYINIIDKRLSFLRGIFYINHCMDHNHPINEGV